MWIKDTSGRKLVNTSYASTFFLGDGDYVGGEPEWYGIYMVSKFPPEYTSDSVCLAHYTSYDDAERIFDELFNAIAENKPTFTMPYITPVFDKKYSPSEIRDRFLRGGFLRK